MPVLDKFREVKYEYPSEDIQEMIITQMMVDHPKLTHDAATEEYRRVCESAQYFVNTTYLAALRPFISDVGEETMVEMAMLTVNRHDRAENIPWEDMQEIKNQLLGFEVEAVELYPAENRNFETRGQHTIWAMPPGAEWPFGFAKDCGMALVGTDVPSAPIPFPPAPEHDPQYDETMTMAINDTAAAKANMNKEFESAFQDGKEDWDNHQFACPYQKTQKSAVEAWILGQKAAAVEFLYQLHKQNNPEGFCADAS